MTKTTAPFALALAILTWLASIWLREPLDIVAVCVSLLSATTALLLFCVRRATRQP